MRSLWLAGFFLAWVATAVALSPDATREQVIAELGKPTSVAKLGKREIMIYPKGVRLELEEGRIVAAKGITLEASGTTVAVVQPAPTPAPAEEDDDKEPPLTEQEKKRIAAEEAAAEKEFAQDGKGHGPIDLDKAVENLSKDHEQAQKTPPSRSFDYVGFAIELFLKFLLTVAALKLACKYWGAEVFWSGIMTVCAVDVAVRGGIALIGEVLLDFPTLFMADELVASIVMMLLLKKLSINHSITQAVELTLTTKTFSIVVGSFVVTVLLRILN